MTLLPGLPHSRGVHSEVAPLLVGHHQHQPQAQQQVFYQWAEAKNRSPFYEILILNFPLIFCGKILEQLKSYLLGRVKIQQERYEGNFPLKEK